MAEALSLLYDELYAASLTALDEYESSSLFALATQAAVVADRLRAEYQRARQLDITSTLAPACAAAFRARAKRVAADDSDTASALQSALSIGIMRREL